MKRMNVHGTLIHAINFTFISEVAPSVGKLV